MTCVREMIQVMTRCLSEYSETPSLDVEILIANELGWERSRLWVNPNDRIHIEQENRIQQKIQRRIDGEPIAYITGYRSFWADDFYVSPAVLVPRPETELIVDWVLTHYSDSQVIRLADLGTGSGAIGISIARERPGWTVDVTDISEKALIIAQQNATRLNIKNINFYLGDWYQALPAIKYDLIVSNPPYIPEKDPHLIQLKKEPQLALSSGPDGLTALKTIIKGSYQFLKEEGPLILEHGYDQWPAVLALMTSENANFSYKNIKNYRDLNRLPRMTMGYLQNNS